MKQQPDGKWMVHDPKTGRWLEVPGYGAMKSTPLLLNEEIDLTKPIFEQVLELEMRQSRKTSRKRIRKG
ncbi:hypothetical protein E3C22_06505 [Jiella endophytica]|uniref:Uncharacterized protein n=2 Tax=Jiella endophytica TaxID=2558362 RepID=A0A4Y8RN77_9HYPH|nr:hypothetical protein E3C22_06505 [Jiella endophytica]